MSRIINAGKTLAKILIPFGHTISFLADKNAPKPSTGYESDGMESLNNYLYRMNLASKWLLDVAELAAEVPIVYHLLK